MLRSARVRDVDPPQCPTHAARHRGGRGSVRRLITVLVGAATVASAADVPVTPTKLIVVDKIATAGSAKVVFVAKDAAVTKGAGTDVDQIDALFEARYEGGPGGRFVVPAGAGSPGWKVNKATVAKFVNKEAPSGPTEAKVAVVKPGKLLKLVGKGLGDVGFDVFMAGAPAGSVFTSYCVTNGGEQNCHCSEFTGCVFKTIASDTGAKLVCKTGTGDPECLARACLVDAGPTVIDACNGLEWEKKDTPIGSGLDPSNLHDGDNIYNWAGRCTLPNADLQQNAFCQPTAAAATTCAARTGGALGCAQCGAGQGTCDVHPPLFGGPPSAAITTVWDWVAQLNASAFAGHDDWRLATSAGTSSFASGEPAEVESIVDPTQGYCGGGAFADPCIDPLFGSIVGTPPYWTATTWSDPSVAVVVQFHDATFPTSGGHKNLVMRVLAVRDWSP